MGPPELSPHFPSSKPLGPRQTMPHQALTSWREETPVFASRSLKQSVRADTQSPIKLCQKRSGFCKKRRLWFRRHTATSQ